MIAFVRGSVAAVGSDSVVVDLGGVGLSVSVPAATAARLRQGEDVHLETSLIVREDSWSLFGFEEREAREVFDILLTVTGIGPRIAAAVLSSHTPDSLRRAVADEDHASLVRVPGIGKKGAARIVLELKDKLGAPGPGAGLPAQPSGDDGRSTVVSGLVGLGWPLREAQLVVDEVAGPPGTGQLDVAATMKAALQKLARA